MKGCFSFEPGGASVDPLLTEWAGRWGATIGSLNTDAVALSADSFMDSVQDLKRRCDSQGQSFTIHFSLPLE